MNSAMVHLARIEVADSCSAGRSPSCGGGTELSSGASLQDCARIRRLLRLVKDRATAYSALDRDPSTKRARGPLPGPVLPPRRGREGGRPRPRALSRHPRQLRPDDRGLGRDPHPGGVAPVTGRDPRCRGRVPARLNFAPSSFTRQSLFPPNGLPQRRARLAETPPSRKMLECLCSVQLMPRPRIQSPNQSVRVCEARCPGCDAGSLR